jgi:hypothetical protein
MPAFNPDLKYMSLEDLTPIVRRVLLAPKKSIWITQPPA